MEIDCVQFLEEGEKEKEEKGEWEDEAGNNEQVKIMINDDIKK